MNVNDKYQAWQKYDLLDFEIDNLKAMEEDENLRQDAFYKDIEFGTAGMRGVIGAGTNRMNRITVRHASKGLALWVKSQGSKAMTSGVVIAYDNRHYSRLFAEETARVLASEGVKAYLFSEMRPTPELSFAVRHLEAAAGVMITASHNPPEYNGYKVYGPDGAQMAPTAIDQLLEFIEVIVDPQEIEVKSIEDLKEDFLVVEISEEVDTPYLEALKSVTQNSKIIQSMADELKVVFSPLHGTGATMGLPALKNAGFKNIYLVEQQMQADPDFSTVKSPNPEDAEAFELAIALGHKVGADILLATDPDADRIGIAVPDDEGVYFVLSGNEIAALLVAYLVEQNTGGFSENAAIVKSIVSGQLPSKIAAKHDVTTVDVLTGFKFIADKIELWESTEEHDFIFGFEESYGYLIEPFARDKDAIQALLVLCELAAYHHSRGKTVYEALQDLFEEYGYTTEETVSLKFEGQAGEQKIAEIMTSFRKNLPKSFDGVKVVVSEDFSTLERINSDGEVEVINSPPANVLKFTLEDGDWVAIRPSGTEPKIKFYVGVTGDSAQASEEKKERILSEIQSKL